MSDTVTLSGPSGASGASASSAATARPGLVARVRTSALRLGGAFAVLAVVGLAVDGNGFWIRIATSAVIAYILTGSFNLIFGYAGLFSLSHVALYGLGGYASVVLETRYDQGFIVATIGAVALSTVAGLLLSLPTTRLGGVFLALGTLAFAIASEELFSKWTGMTGGAQGFLGIQPPEVFGQTLLGGTIDYFWFAGVVAVLCFEVFFRISRSAVGRNLVALRESEVAAQSAGVNPVRVRIIAFGVSGLFAGLAGVLLAHFTLFISPESFSLDAMIEVLMVTLIGGAGTVLGPIFGVVALVVIDEGGHSIGDASPLLFGVAIVVIISFAPDGLVGRLARLFRFATRRSTAATVAAHEAESEESAVLDVEELGAVPIRAVPTPTTAARVLTVDGATLRFDGVTAVDAISFEVRSGEVIGLIGPNGAGKTSTVNLITGMIRPTAGDIRLDGRSLVGTAPHDIANQGVVRTFQSTRLVPTFDLITNVMMGRTRFARATLIEQLLLLPRARRDDVAAREVALRLLEVVGVAEHAETRAADLPYGVLRRAEIAKAMAPEPAFLLLDEPGAGLSAFERGEVGVAIAAVAAEGVGCVLIDHNVPFVAAACSRLVVLAGGRILTSGFTDEVLAHADVVEAYLGSAATA